MFGPNFATTLERLQPVLHQLGTAGLKLKAKKCQLFQEEIQFLGHIVSAKCQQVRDWPVCPTLRYDRLWDCARTIEGTSVVSLSWPPPYTNWRPRGRTLSGRSGGTSIQRAETALTSTPILGFPLEDGPWYLDTNESDVWTGAVLSQVQDGEERVIGYANKSLEWSEQQYCTARKELLASVRALKHFKCYLYGQKITVRTDNSDVKWTR